MVYLHMVPADWWTLVTCPQLIAGPFSHVHMWLVDQLNTCQADWWTIIVTHTQLVGRPFTHNLHIKTLKNACIQCCRQQVNTRLASDRIRTHFGAIFHTLDRRFVAAAYG